MLLIECCLDVLPDGNIIVDKDTSQNLQVEEGDEFVVFIRDGRVIFAKKKG
jgi:formylmethanofuran dehydrogenase subunit D